METPAKHYRAPNQLSEEREEELIDAARAVFIEKGLGKTTIDTIAKRARINKVTIYRRYSDKYDLFETVIERMAERTGTRLADLELDPDQPMESLRAAALQIRSQYKENTNLELTRLMIAEASRHPELCQRARALMIANLADKLIRFFETLIENGRMESTYPREAAISFVLIFSRGFRPLFNVIGSEEQENRQFESDFTMFVRGNGITSSDPATPGRLTEY